MFVLVIILILLLIEKPRLLKADPFCISGEKPAEGGYISGTPDIAGYLSTEYTTQLRGIFALLVVYSHLALNAAADGMFGIFSTLGSYDVGIFFFLSGYGLLVQYQKKGKDYLKGFLWRRVVISLVIPYIIFNVIYYAAYHLMGNPVSVRDMLYSWVNGHPLVSNSWYIIAIFYFYLVFLIAALLSRVCLRELTRGRLWLVAGLCFLGSLAWMVICHAMGYGDWWFYSCFPLNAGMLWVLIHKKAESWFAKLFWLKEALLLILCIVLYHAALILPQYIGMQTPIYLGYMQLSAVLFSVFIVCLGMRIRFEGKCLALLGRCSLELYLVHGLFLMLFRGDVLYLENPLVYSLAVVAASCLAAYVLHRLLEAVKRGLKRAGM